MIKLINTSSFDSTFPHSIYGTSSWCSSSSSSIYTVGETSSSHMYCKGNYPIFIKKIVLQQNAPSETKGQEKTYSIYVTIMFMGTHFLSLVLRTCTSCVTQNL